MELDEEDDLDSQIHRVSSNSSGGAIERLPVSVAHGKARSSLPSSFAQVSSSSSNNCTLPPGLLLLETILSNLTAQV